MVLLLRSKEGDTGYGAGTSNLCHGLHFIGVGRKQRVHPVELLIILTVALRILFITSHSDPFGEPQNKTLLLVIH